MARVYLLPLVILKGKTIGGDKIALPKSKEENKDHDYRFTFGKSCSYYVIQSFLWSDSGNCSKHPVGKYYSGYK